VDLSALSFDKSFDDPERKQRGSQLGDSGSVDFNRSQQITPESSDRNLQGAPGSKGEDQLVLGQAQIVLK